MPISRALLLKGLGGVAAVGAVGVGGYGIAKPNDFFDLFKSKKTIEGEKKNKADEINKELKDLGLSEEVCKLENSDFSNTTEYSKECELDKDKFKKIKFSNAGDNDVEVQGWTGENKIKLKISNKSNGGIRFLFKDVKDDLTITKSSTEKNEKVTIRKEKETEFELKDQKLSKVVDQAFKDKLDGINKKMVGAGLPTDCSFDITEKDKTLECGLDDAKLKAIKFSNKGSAESLTVTGSTSNIKIKVDLSEKIDDPSFSFSGLSEDLTILGESSKGKIVIKKEGDRKFRIAGEKLEKVSLNKLSVTSKLEKFNKQLSTLSLPDDCRFDVAEQDKVLECGLDDAKLKAIKFSNKPASGDPTFSGTIESSLKIKVEAKDDENDATFSFTGLSQDLIIYGDKKANIVLKSSSATPVRTFKEKDGKLVKVVKDTAKVEKLKKINKELEDLKIQDKCRFDENDDDTSFECELTLDEFKAIKLTSKEDGGSLTVAADATPTKMKLKIELKNTESQGDETIYTLSDLDKKIKFGKTGEEITLDSGKPHEFEVREEKLGPKRLLLSKATNDHGNNFTIEGLSCGYENKLNNKGTCKTTTTFIDLLFNKTTGKEEVESITWSGNQESFDFWEYQEGFEGGIKFTYKGETHNSSTNSSWSLEKNKDYELKENVDNRWFLKMKGD